MGLGYHQSRGTLGSWQSPALSLVSQERSLLRAVIGLLEAQKSKACIRERLEFHQKQEVRLGPIRRPS